MLRRITGIRVFIFFILFMFGCSQITEPDRRNNSKDAEVNKILASIVIDDASGFKDCTFSYLIKYDGMEYSFEIASSVLTVELPLSAVNIEVNVYGADKKLVARGSVSGSLTDKQRVIFIELIKLSSDSDDEDDDVAEVINKPVFTPGEGVYNAGKFQGFTITASNENAVVYYTLDGSKPDNSKIKYSGKVSLNETAVVKAVVYKDGKYSDAVSVVYTLTEEDVVLPVQFSQAGGSYELKGFSGVSLSTETEGAVIRYTLNGENPDGESLIYSESINFSKAGIYKVKAMAFKEGMVNSSISQAEYVITETFETLKKPLVIPEEKKYSIKDFPGIELINMEEGVSYRYTLNGGEPDEFSSLYASKIPLDKNGVVDFRVRGFKEGFNPSEVVLKTYTIAENEQIVVLPPVISPDSGTYSEDKFTGVVVSNKQSGGVTYFTINSDSPRPAVVYETETSLSDALDVGQHSVTAWTVFQGVESDKVTKNYVIEEKISGKIVYFKDNAGWGERRIYYYDDTVTPAKSVSAWNSMPAMEDAGNGWFKYHLTEDWVSDNTSVIFFGGSNASRFPLDQQPGVKIFSWSKGYFLLSDKIWSEKNPEAPVGPSIPVISVSPNGGIHKGNTSITISITGEDVTSRTLTFNGNEISLVSNSRTITLSDYIDDGLTGSLVVTAKNSIGTADKTVSFTRNDNTAKDVIIHFRKPSDWGNAYIHYWDTVVNTPTQWTNGKLLSHTGGGWYSVELLGDSKASFLFKDAPGEPLKRQEGYAASGEVWIDNRTVYTRNPDWAQPAVLSVTPDGGYFKTTQSITLNIALDSRTALLESKYSINGANPKSEGVSFTSGTQITIGSGMADNAILNLRLWSRVRVNDSGELLETEKSVSFVKGEIGQPSKLGAEYSKTATKFSIWSPDTSDVKVKVDGAMYTCQKTANFSGYTDIYTVTVPGDLHLKEYEFYINGRSVRDPYGVMIKPKTNTNIVIDMSKTEPDGGWASLPPLLNREDTIIYEVHVRDFTIDPSSGVSAGNRGKFMGMVERGTTYKGVKTGIDHLIELGVTHVQILPFYDYAADAYSWGYDPVNYNIPEEQYASDPYNYVGRIKEVKTMINEFHKNGIRVIMDVVYNHTASNEMFENITLKYYTGNNDSGCGNGINTGVPMVSRMIQDSQEFWVSNYNVDGFRHDLAGIFHYDEFRKWGEHLNVHKFPERNLIILGEPWNGYWTDPQSSQKVRLGTAPAFASGRMGVFNSKYREAIKGGSDNAVRGYMFNNVTDNGWAVANGMRGSIMAVKSRNPLGNEWDPMFAYDPEQSINYITAHDNYGLWDKIVYTLGNGNPSGVDAAYAERISKFGNGMILTSQGIPFIHGGEEILRTKTKDGEWRNTANWKFGNYGTHNTYNAPDSFNSYKWQWKVDNIVTFNYYRDLIKLRKEQKALRLTTWEEINTHMRTSTANGGQVVIGTITGVSGASDLMVVFNSGSNYTIDNSGWTKIFDNSGLNPSNQSGVCEGTAVTVFKR